MMLFRLAIILLSCFSLSSFASNPPVIVVSIPPIASLVKTIVGDLAEVEIIQKISSCPHHSEIKPSSVSLIKKADYLVFIDHNFEPDFSKYSKNPNLKKIEISKFEQLHIEKNNLHIWLDLENILVILGNIKAIMLEDGFDRKTIEENYSRALEKLNSLRTNFDSSNILVVGDSLYYLIPKINPDNYFEITKNSSLKKLNNLKEVLAKNQIHCLIHDKTMEDRFFGKLFPGEIVAIDIEDWGDFNQNLSEYYFSYIQNIYSKFSLCKKDYSN